MCCDMSDRVMWVAGNGNGTIVVGPPSIWHRHCLFAELMNDGSPVGYRFHFFTGRTSHEMRQMQRAHDRGSFTGLE